MRYKKYFMLLGLLMPISASAQSTGIPWVNGKILTDRMMQTQEPQLHIAIIGGVGLVVTVALLT